MGGLLQTEVGGVVDIGGYWRVDIGEYWRGDIGKSGFLAGGRILLKTTGHVQAIQVLYTFNTTIAIAFIIFAITIIIIAITIFNNIVITIFITRQFFKVAAAAVLSTFCFDKIASGKGSR